MSQKYNFDDAYLEEPLLSSETKSETVKRSKKYTILFIILVLVFLLQLSLFNKSYQNNYPIPEEPRNSLGVDGIDKCLYKYMESVSDKIPENVNQLTPTNIGMIAALGDSITAGTESMLNDTTHPEYSFITGTEPIHKHISIYSLFKFSHRSAAELKNYNLAQPGATSRDLMRQVKLLELLAKKDEPMWKLVFIFIGINDVGNLGLGSQPPIEPDEYSRNLEKSVKYIAENIPKTVVMLIGLPKPQLFLEARSLWNEGKRARSKSAQESVDLLVKSYQKALNELQTKYNSNNMSVVVQPFMTEYDTMFTDAQGKFDKLFYSDDIFHPSKLGHSIMAKHLWNNIFEPVGKKTTKANLGDVSGTIRCLDDDNSIIRTVKNS